jgi:hypothetical protein
MQSPKKVGEDIQKATLDWKGLKITVKLTIQNRQVRPSMLCVIQIGSVCVYRNVSSSMLTLLSGSPGYCQSHPFGLLYDHQGPQGAPAGQEEGRPTASSRTQVYGVDSQLTASRVLHRLSRRRTSSTVGT